jgi:hypothetical protein
VIDKALYVTTEELGVFRLDAISGGEVWNAPGIQQILSISSKHVYGMDGSGRLLVLDAKSGARLDAMPTHGLNLIHTNMQTDRLILATQTGLVQCLREAGQREPIVHNPQVKKPVAAPADAETPDDAAPADDADDPFNADENAAEDAAMDEEPADEEAMDEEAMDAEEEPADDEAVDEEGDDPFGS